MKQLLIIPDVNNMQETLRLANEYNLGFEYNDFFDSAVLDDEQKLEELLTTYRNYPIPSYCTSHGAFFDVIPFSNDRRIREVSDLRIKQSIEVAWRLGTQAVVFHTNYNPFLNTSAYVNCFIEQNVEYWSGILGQYPKMSIYLENMFDSSPDIMVELSDSLCKYPNYGVCLDYAHAAISQVPPEEWAKRLGRFVKHVHINDNDLISDLHLAWGDGKIDRKVFYKSYEKYMGDATMLIETVTTENKLRSIRKLQEEGFLK